MGQSQEAHARFQAIMERYVDTPDVSIGKMFGSIGLKTNGKVFAMLVKDKLVVKLPTPKVEELVAMGRGVLFDPGHGRLMKEWISVELNSNETEWSNLVEEAKAFVGPLT